MKPLAASLSLVMVSVIVGTIATQASAAEQAEKEEYVSTAESKTLVQKPVEGMDGKRITIQRITAPPEWVGGRHYHSGPVFVYVTKGSFAVDEEGKPQQTFEAGEVYEEPIGETMQARNLSNAEAVELLVIQVSDEDEPLMYKAD